MGWRKATQQVNDRSKIALPFVASAAKEDLFGMAASEPQHKQACIYSTADLWWRESR